MVALRVPFAEWVGVGGAPGDGDEVLGLLDEHHQHPARPPVAPVRPGGRGVGRRGADLWRRDKLEGDDDLAAVAAVCAGGQRGLRQRGGGGGGEGERHDGGGWRGGRRLGGVAVDDQVGLKEW